MTRYATCECYNCHARVPKNEAISKTIQVNTGKSGGGFSFFAGQRRKNGRRKNSFGYHTGRQYYSNKEVWVCKECSKGSAVGGFFAILVIVGIILFLVL